MIINDLDGYYIVFDTKNWNTELDTLVTDRYNLSDFKTWVFTLVKHIEYAVRSKSLKHSFVMLIVKQYPSLAEGC